METDFQLIFLLWLIGQWLLLSNPKAASRLNEKAADQLAASAVSNTNVSYNGDVTYIPSLDKIISLIFLQL